MSQNHVPHSESQTMIRTRKGFIPQGLNVSIKELQQTVGFTQNSSLLSKTIRFLRTQPMGTQNQRSQNLDKILSTLESQRKKIKYTQNKLKLTLTNKEIASKEILSSINMKQEEQAVVKMKKLEDKLKQHSERLYKLRKDSENHKGSHITDLFRQIKETKNDYIPIPPQLVDKSIEEEGGTFNLTEYQEQIKKKDKKNRKDQSTNPFDQHGTKEMWEKIVDLAKNNQAIKFPDIGIEKTPIFHLQQAQGQQSINKKNDFYTRLIKGDFIYKGKVNKLNFQNMYEEIAYLKSYQPRIEKIDPINKNLLSHKLAKAMEQAGVLWGQRENRAGSLHSLNDYDRSMEQFLDDSKHGMLLPAKRSTQSQQHLKTRQYMFTKQHQKVPLVA